MTHPMKTLPLFLLALAANAHAQYTIDWFTMDGGGGSGAVGSYQIAGTIGQPDVVTGNAGPFTFIGGFWSHPNEPLPTLRIFLAAQNIVLAWPNPSTGFELQASPALLPTDWKFVDAPPTIVGSEKQVLWGSKAGTYFFRLRRP